MSVVYIRLPHYVASYLRNADLQNPIPAGQPIVVEASDPLYTEFAFRSIPNMRNHVGIDCFSQKQWEAMTRGKYLTYRGGFSMDMVRDKNLPLMLGEIFTLAGAEARVRRDPETMELLPDSEYIDEYVPFLLPRVVVREGREMKVYSDFFIPDVKRIKNELINRYRYGAIDYISKELAEAISQGVSLSVMEALDRFYIRFDIRTGDREREQGKKMLQRMEASLQYSLRRELDRKHNSQQLPDLRIRQFTTRPQRIYCVDTQQYYDSIHAFARAIGADPSNVAKALRRGYRCNGFSFRLADDK